MLRDSMQQEIQELINIGSDIENNMEAVEAVQLSIYKQVMGNYREKLMQAYEFLEIEINPLPQPTLVFP